MSDSDSSSLSPIGSPPLILACLAIGIFSAALISVFGWRRVRLANDAGRRGIDDGETFGRPGLDSWGNSRGRSGFGEKPVMWDVWTDRNATVNGMDYGCWNHVMPLAVHSRSLEFSNNASAAEMSPPSVPSVPALPSTAARRRPLLGFTDNVLFSLHRRTATLDPLLPTDVDEDGKEDEANEIAEVEEEKQTQVVVVVEMPSLVSSRRRHSRFGNSEHQKYPSYYSAFSKSETLVETHDRMREELLEPDIEEGEHQYCIGVHSCPWPVSTKLKDDKEASRTIQNS